MLQIDDNCVPQTLINMFYSKSFERNIFLLDYFIKNYISRVLDLCSCLLVCSRYCTQFSDDIAERNNANARKAQWSEFEREKKKHTTRCTHSKNTNFPILRPFFWLRSFLSRCNRTMDSCCCYYLFSSCVYYKCWCLNFCGSHFISVFLLIFFYFISTATPSMHSVVTLQCYLQFTLYELVGWLFACLV